MKNKLSTLVELVKYLPGECLDQAIESLEKLKKEAERKEGNRMPDCPHCHGENSVRNGSRKGKQRYLCRECGKSFVRTTGTALCHSHRGEAVWKQVIRDTVNGTPLEETAGSPGMGRRYRAYVNRMRPVYLKVSRGRGCLRGIGGRRGSTGRYPARAAFPVNMYAYVRPLNVTGRRIRVRYAGGFPARRKSLGRFREKPAWTA